MTLAWKVMLPLGLLNLAAIAVWTEYGPRFAAQLGIMPTALAVALGWLTLVIGWVGAALVSPLHSDNRPQFSVGPWTAERRLVP